MPYFEVLQDGCVKRPCNADLVFSSWVLNVRMKTFEKTEGTYSENVYKQTSNYKKK